MYAGPAGPQWVEGGSSYRRLTDLWTSSAGALRVDSFGQIPDNRASGKRKKARRRQEADLGPEDAGLPQDHRDLPRIEQAPVANPGNIGQCNPFLAMVVLDEQRIAFVQNLVDKAGDQFLHDQPADDEDQQSCRNQEPKRRGLTGLTRSDKRKIEQQNDPPTTNN